MTYIEPTNIDHLVTITRRHLVGNRTWVLTLKPDGGIEMVLPSPLEEPMTARELQILLEAVEQVPMVVHVALSKKDEGAAPA